MSSPLVVAALQLQTLGFNPLRLEFYFKNAHARGAKVMVFGEYVLNHFFKELAVMPHSMVKEQSEKHLKLLKSYAIEYDMTIIAPVVMWKKEGFVKTIAKIGSSNTHYYEQQILIPYRHWDEQSFFKNKIKALKPPLIFTINGYKIMVMAGYEMHFPPFWNYVRAKKIDLVIRPTSSTFGSHNRWREIIKTQAFLYETYILRVNRLGEYSDKNIKWRFYGDSMLVRPDGEVEMMLEDKESMLVEEIDKNVLKHHKKEWRFGQALNLRKKLK